MTLAPRTNLFDFDAEELARVFAAHGDKPFRAKQVLRWLHRAGECRFDAMTDLAKTTRERLTATMAVIAPTVLADSTASDGTRKWLLDVGAGNAIETVYIPAVHRGTLCISTQAGCALDCAFCSTGKQGFNRNLTTGEIIGQLWLAEHRLRAAGVRVDSTARADGAGGDEGAESPASARGAESPASARGAESPASARGADSPASARGAESRVPQTRSAESPAPARAAAPVRAVSNVVLMGMGEPLLNFDALVPALRLMLDDSAYGLSRRRVTVSTSGIVPNIDRLRVECPVALAVSLHAPNDRLRDQLMPINRKYPIAVLLEACRRYLARAPRDFITFEYVMLAGVNDSDRHADELAAILADVPSKVNLIPFNPFPQAGFARSSGADIRRFSDRLNAAAIVTTTRTTRGDDIDAACGQLAGQVHDRTRRVVRLAARAAAVA